MAPYSFQSVAVCFTLFVTTTAVSLIGTERRLSSARVPMPTQQQLQWLEAEIGIMVSFDMITMITEVPNPQHFCIGAGNDPLGFAVPPATRWTPSNSTFTDSWMEAALAVNAKYTLMVASHCSGFLQWPSNVYTKYGLPDYTTRSAAYWRGGQGDAVADYMASAQKYNLPASFYLSLNYNYLFNYGYNSQCPGGLPCVVPGPLGPGQIQANTSFVQQINVETIVEVWKKYPGQLFELWFDGGEDIPALNAALAQYQPQALAISGTASGGNNARLVGAEGGFTPYPTWLTGTYNQGGQGSPNGPDFVPAEMDSPILQKDTWFWKPDVPIRSLAELKGMYHTTVGSSSVLELGVMPDDTGFVPADQMQLLQGLGDYVRKCFSPSAAVGSTSGPGSSITLQLAPLPQNGTVGAAYPIVDKLVLQEQLNVTGQAVLSYSVSIDTGTGYKAVYMDAGAGQAVGAKRIHFLTTGPLPARSIIVNVTSTVPGSTGVLWRNVAAYSPCD